MDLSKSTHDGSNNRIFYRALAHGLGMLRGLIPLNDQHRLLEDFIQLRSRGRRAGEPFSYTQLRPGFGWKPIIENLEQ